MMCDHPKTPSNRDGTDALCLVGSTKWCDPFLSCGKCRQTWKITREQERELAQLWEQGGGKRDKAYDFAVSLAGEPA